MIDGKAHHPELTIVGSALVVVHLFFWWQGQPIAHSDLSGYTEQAMLLATRGVIAAPASQHVDLTYVRAVFFYPPGYTLAVGAWIKLFGSTPPALLAYTHLIHASYLFFLWVLLRNRFDCTRPAAALAVASAFPMFNHGRPDGTALLLGVLAWLVIPAGLRASRLCLSGLLLGLAVLLSPAFGLGSALAVASYHIFGAGDAWNKKFIGAGVVAVVAVLTFGGVWAAVLWWQDAWALGLEQFRVNLLIRGGELNRLPPNFFLTKYSAAFMVVPFVLLTLFPLAVVLCRWRRSSGPARLAALSYLCGLLGALSLNKLQFLSGSHFAFPPRPVLHGATASSRDRVVAVAGVISLCAFTAVHCYFEKRNLLYLGSNLSGAYGQVAGLKIDPEAVVAVDSHFFTTLYREDRTIKYEIFMGMRYWERYRAETSPSVLSRLQGVIPDAPLVPDVIVVSAMTLKDFGHPDPAAYRMAEQAEAGRALSILGIRFAALPQNPLRPFVFYRNE